MKTESNASFPRRMILLPILGVMALLLSPGKMTAQGGWFTLANPHWNITLTDAGYSDYLLDNTPGFEGREYLSGEWGAAVGYQHAVGTVVAPLWLERNFWFPDWVTDSNFGVKSSIAQIGFNADNLPIAQSIITNSHLEITLRHEMLDTVVGTPMGTTRASGGDAGSSIPSSRYLLKQTATIKNISGGAISGVQFFQFVHGMNTQRGVYDNRNYAGPFSEYQYDVTLAGVDPWAAGTNSSSAGLEDYLGFQASVAPTAFEIGFYGVEGNGLDDHSIGKPSEGVHLSIENNWQTPPYSTRQGTDSFAPVQHWISGAQRWDLGNLAAGQSVSFDVVLSLRTGTKVTTGTGSSGGCNGGSGVPGGLDYEFDDVTEDGSCFADYSKADEIEIEIRIAQGEFEPFTFMTPGGPAQIWEVTFNGVNSGAILLTFAYDPTILPEGLDQSTLDIYHFQNHAWQKLNGTVDLARHTITVTTASLSAFALGVDGGTTYNVSVTVAPPVSGTIIGGGTYPSGAAVTLVATPATGYVFTNWTEGGVEVSSSPSYTFAAQADRVLGANFVSAGGNLIISTSSSPANGGATLGDGAYAPGVNATVIAIPNAGYKFSKWLVGEAIVSTSRTNTFTATTNCVMVAKFKPVYSVAVSADPPNGGEVEADPVYEVGELAKLKAKPMAGWCFLNWTQNGALVSTDPNYRFNVTASRTLVGHFAQGNRIDASVYLGIGGTATGGGVYQNGANATVVANANSGYVFLKWTENGVPVSASQSYTLTSDTNHTLVANFVAQPSVSLNPGAPGTLLISWPAAASGWALHECTDMSLGDWAISARTVSVVGNQKQVTITPLTGNGFFRLVHP